MKNFFSITLLSLSCVVALAGNPPPAPALFVNGIVTILGDRRVVFKIFPAGGGENSAILAEGETYDGIRLLSVDVKTSVAHFDNHGLLQNIPLCDPPDLNAAAAKAGGLAPNSHPHFFQTASAAAQGSAGGSDFNQAGFGFAGGVGGGAGVRKDTSGNAADKSSPAGQPQNSDAANQPQGGDNSGQSQNSDSASTPAAPANPDAGTWWYRASEETEAVRQTTADAVLRGDAQPFPLTPLTPAGTDSRLVSTNAVYFNHFQPPY